MRYQAYGLTLTSDFPLPELIPAAAEPGAQADIQVRLSECHGKFSAPSQPIMCRTLPTGTLWLTCAKYQRGYGLRFPTLADFLVDASGREITCVATPEISQDTLRHLLLDQVLPLVLNLRGQEVLHATAVLTPFGVCVFTGPSGTGKSTLAASFLVAGYPVLSDDCLVLEEYGGVILATPAYPGLRLWEDTLGAVCENPDPLLPVAHYTSKQRLVLGEHPRGLFTDQYPVIRIYSLVRPAEVENNSDIAVPFIQPLCQRDAFMELIPHAFRLDITDRDMLVRQFSSLERIVAQVRVQRLWIPNTFASLPMVREVILADLSTEREDRHGDCRS